MPGHTHSHIVVSRGARTVASDLAALAVLALAAAALACSAMTSAGAHKLHRLCAGPCGSPSAARGAA